jgi:predicted GNAT superfamily acetyltransferase
VHPPLIRHLDDSITVRRAESIADYRACQEAQRLAWGIGEDGYVIPVATMVGANLHGGLVLGAFQDNGQAVGMSFGFLGRIEQRLCLYSQLTGVVPEWQARGLGFELKMVQREFARESDIPLIAWAFDPLQSGNARFNLVRLGARVRRYVENMYGFRTDALNAGVPTDRVIAEWETRLGEQAMPGDAPASLEALPHLILTTEAGSGLRLPREVNERPTAPSVLVEIPARIAELRREQPEAAEAWREAVGRALRAGFVAGYCAVGFVSEESRGARRCAYVLQGPGSQRGAGHGAAIIP